MTFVASLGGTSNPASFFRPPSLSKHKRHQHSPLLPGPPHVHILSLSPHLLSSSNFRFQRHMSSIGSLAGSIQLVRNWKGSCVFSDGDAVRLSGRRSARRDLLFVRTGWKYGARLRAVGGKNGAGGSLEGGADEADERAHATIAKSKQVLEMQSSLLDQVS